MCFELLSFFCVLGVEMSVFFWFMLIIRMPCLLVTFLVPQKTSWIPSKQTKYLSSSILQAKQSMCFSSHLCFQRSCLPVRIRMGNLFTALQLNLLLWATAKVSVLEEKQRFKSIIKYSFCFPRGCILVVGKMSVTHLAVSDIVQAFSFPYIISLSCSGKNMPIFRTVFKSFRPPLACQNLRSCTSSEEGRIMKSQLRIQNKSLSSYLLFSIDFKGFSILAALNVWWSELFITFLNSDNKVCSLNIARRPSPGILAPSTYGKLCHFCSYWGVRYFGNSSPD